MGVIAAVHVRIKAPKALDLLHELLALTDEHGLGIVDLIMLSLGLGIRRVVIQNVSLGPGLGLVIGRDELFSRP